MKRWSKMTVAGLLAMALFATMAGTAAAELPAPVFMPGFPMVAGPQIMVMWQPVAGAAKYIVYIDGKTAGEVTAFQYFGPAPTEGGEHPVEVQAVDGAGAKGRMSEKKVVKIVKLGTPKALMLREIEGGKVSLRWDPVTGAMIYDVFVSEEKGKEGKLLGSVQGNVYVDGNAKRGVTLFYSITAKDATGVSSGRSPEGQIRLQTEAEMALQEKKAEAEKVAETFLPVKELMCVRVGAFGGFNNPTSILAHDGKIYVADSGNQRILVFGKDGDFIEQWPKDGAGWKVSYAGSMVVQNGILHIANSKEILRVKLDGSLHDKVSTDSFDELRPHAGNLTYTIYILTVAKDGTIYAGSSNNKVIFVLDKNLKPVRYIDVSGDVGTIASLSLAPDEKSLYFSDVLSASVAEFGTDGKFLRRFGEYGVVAGKIGRASFVLRDGENYLIGDMMSTRVHVFGKDGKYRFDLGKSEKAVQEFLTPTFGYFDTANRVLYYTDGLSGRFCAYNVPELK